MKPHIKVTSSALIQRDDKVLLNQFQKDQRIYYNLPGGIVEPGETLAEALQREVCEETNVDVQTIGDLLLTWEYEPRHLNKKYGKRHKIGFVFQASIADEAEPQLPERPDKNQINVVWMPLDELPEIDLQPDIGTMIIDALDNVPRMLRFYEET